MPENNSIFEIRHILVGNLINLSNPSTFSEYLPFSVLIIIIVSYVSLTLNFAGQ